MPGFLRSGHNYKWITEGQYTCLQKLSTKCTCITTCQGVIKTNNIHKSMCGDLCTEKSVLPLITVGSVMYCSVLAPCICYRTIASTIVTLHYWPSTLPLIYCGLYNMHDLVADFFLIVYCVFPLLIFLLLLHNLHFSFFLFLCNGYQKLLATHQTTLEDGCSKQLTPYTAELFSSFFSPLFSFFLFCRGYQKLLVESDRLAFLDIYSTLG